jgi:protein-S-isoprenylcysteine O-methyltransferase Ste14
MRRLIQSIPRVLVFEAVLGAILFTSAGRIDLPWVWTLLAVHTVLLTVGMTFMDPTLGRERLRPGPGAQDVATKCLASVLLLTHLVIAGLDVGRYHWSGPIPLPVRLVALAAFTCGMAFSLWAMVVNRFFSSIVRLQTDRGHHVIDTGPYRIVRHPGYAGLVFSAVAGGIVLGSWWSLLPLAVMALLMARRMVMEDAFLHRELAGYPEYAGRVRYKLLPGLW